MQTAITSCVSLTRQPMSQKFVCATCLISGRSAPVSRTNGESGVGARERRFDRRGVDAGPQPRVDRLEDPAIERHQVRHERDRHAELLLDLRGMPVREHAVRRDAVVALGEVRALARRLARPRNARLGVDDDAGLEQPVRDERLQRQHGRGRIAAGARDEPGARRARRGGARSARTRRRPASPASADTSAAVRPCPAAERPPTDRTRECPGRRAPGQARPPAFRARRETRHRSRSRADRRRAARPACPRSWRAPGSRFASDALDAIANRTSAPGCRDEPAEQFEPGIAGGASDPHPDRGILIHQNH